MDAPRCAVGYVLKVEGSPMFLVTFSPGSREVQFRFTVERVTAWENAFDVSTFETQDFFWSAMTRIGTFTTNVLSSTEGGQLIKKHVWGLWQTGALDSLRPECP